MPGPRARLFSMVLVLVLVLSSLLAGTAGATPAAAGTDTITIVSATGTQTVLNGAALAALPRVQVPIAVKTEHGPTKSAFAGPLLWSVLAAGHALDPKKFKAAVHEALVVTGADGYTAVLALGELAPALENKQVVLATQLDGKPLPPGHWRLAIPGEGRAGRDVYDVVRLAVVDLAPAVTAPPK
jgi:hypothetical protein